MKRSVILAGVAALMVMGGMAEAQQGGRFRERLAERMGGGRGAPAAPADQTIAYGSDPLQAVDFWKASGASAGAPLPAPLVVFVHGGGWKRGDKDNATGALKVEHYAQAGYTFASVNYRLVPQATIEQQAADVAAAVKALVDRADALGFDRSRIVLMGHSAGAHLVALVGTDERYLKAAGLSFADIRGVIPIDGAAYDVPAQMQDGGRFMQATYKQAFGEEPGRQAALSPTLQAAAPNAPAFLLPHVGRADGTRQAEGLAAALTRAGTPAKTAAIPGEGLRGHMEINRRLGDPAYPATAVVDAFLKDRFGG